MAIFFGRQAALSPTASQRVPSFAISASGSDFNSQNPQCIPAVKIFAFSDSLLRKTLNGYKEIKEKGMASKEKETRLNQKTYWEGELNQRLSVLADKGLEPNKIARDTAVRKIRAKMRETGGRLRVIAGLEKKREEMASIKAEKLAAPKQEKGKKKKKAEEQAESKRQQKKKKKKGSGDKA